MPLSRFNKIQLGVFPTPIQKLPRLSAHLGGPQIYIKRDDLTGLALGGNKTRKLEYLLADALAKDSDCIITAGAAQSNHCRQTAAAAAMLGLECHLVLGGQAPNVANGNLLLDQLFAAHIHWSGDKRKGEDIPNIVAALREQGRNPYVVPYGGSNMIGALGFINAFYELHAQCKDAAMPAEFSDIVFASSSGATHCGLVLGKAMCNVSSRIIGINIDKDEQGKDSYKSQLHTLIKDTANKLAVGYPADIDEIQLKDDYIGAGYGVVGVLEREAIALCAQLEGILLDPVYTGRAMGGLIDMIRKGRFSADSNVLFWHTGGAPALFSYAEVLQQVD
ncbi:D-cysteine desulfhydrase family protein [Paraglaciecola chathamensis]|uniref:D-cysteine desulfhydrase family protein n=1 Tax=Paraglaciecola chathamensis TaxID=368405 RepID=UPI0026FE8395|nr:D-cysteine desulfhydrase family protein [Paraglaciecola chathamensis]MDO6558537.1 D-cysteine desulfhydrase family protein [Paraglaciecola chathamensis]